MRYFVRLGADGEAVSLYRFALPENSILEERWTNDGWVDNPDADIARYLALGEGEYQEISEDVATQIFPTAFLSVDKAHGKYRVSKAEGEKRYTLGAMYIPKLVDAHGEWTDEEELQRAVWDYVRTNDRRIRLQHDREIVAGEWVEVMAFPYEITVPITNPEGHTYSHTYPANTVFLGVIWEPGAWEKVKSGEILGYSIGGKAERLYVDIEDELEKNDPTVSDVHVDTIMTPSRKKPKKDNEL